VAEAQGHLIVTRESWAGVYCGSPSRIPVVPWPSAPHVTSLCLLLVKERLSAAAGCADQRRVADSDARCPHRKHGRS
jgi:hypothetical protein